MAPNKFTRGGEMGSSLYFNFNSVSWKCNAFKYAYHCLHDLSYNWLCFVHWMHAEHGSVSLPGIASVLELSVLLRQILIYTYYAFSCFLRAASVCVCSTSQRAARSQLALSRLSLFVFGFEWDKVNYLTRAEVGRLYATSLSQSQNRSVLTCCFRELAPFLSAQILPESLESC